MIVNNWVDGFGLSGRLEDITNSVRSEMSEALVQQRVRMAIQQLGGRLWRNNTGAVNLPSGRVLRYGLANDSKQVNVSLKSADLIGILPIRITPDMLGKTVGVFVSVEAKAGTWKFSENNPRDVAQRNWNKLVYQCGGIAGFSTGGEI
jgi:hypothetical protein